MKKIKYILFFLIICIIFPLVAFARGRVTIILVYAHWHNDTDKAQVVMQNFADSYGGRVDYFLCNVDEPDSCKYVKKHKIRTPQKVPSVMLFLDNKLVLEKYFDPSDSENFVKPFDELILSHI